MREIEFRGKRTDNGEWVHGYLLIYENEAYIFEEVDPDTVGQYTGLKDKNGTKIYEGDILSFSNMREECTSIVMWNDEIGAWCLKIKNATRIGEFPLGKWLSDEELEVIGNIHDNKELLEL